MKHLAALIGFLCAILPAAAVQPSARLATRDTVLVVAAGPQAPRLVSLSSPGAAAWQAEAPAALISRVQVNGQWVPLHWRYAGKQAGADHRSVTFVYDNSSPHLRLLWHWQARDGVGPIEHTITIRNLSAAAVELPLQNSWSFNWRVPAAVPLEEMWIEKGAGTPSPEGTHLISISDGYHWEGTSSTYANPPAGAPREMIPWMLVQQRGTRAAGWYTGIEFSGRTHITLERNGDSLQGEAGLNPNPGPYSTRVAAGGSFVTPTIFVGAFTGGSENAGNILRGWVRQVLLNPADLRNPEYPLLVNNSWGSGMAIDETQARQMIADSAALGLEMFHIDAGWFRGVGDWYPSPVKFPHGLAPIAEDAHRHGLKFGIWVDWTQAGTDTEPGAINVHDPRVRDWLTQDMPADWRPEAFKGVTMDLGNPAVQAWAGHELNRMVNDYHLDMLEHDGYLVAQGCDRDDHPHAVCPPSRSSYAPAGHSPFVMGSNSTDVSYFATRAYYTLYRQLREKHPNLLLEVCNDGGRMVDFGSAEHGDYFSITDTYDPLSNRRAFYDASHVLPSPMLECYVEKWKTPQLANFRYMLRSGMMGWLTIMQDTNAWTPEQHAAARQEFQLYKTRLRPFIRTADLYHISPRPDGVHWDGIEYYAPARGQGVIYAFHGSTPAEAEHTFPLRGIAAHAIYRLHFQDHSSPDRTVSGDELLQKGLTVHLPLPDSSELVFLTRTGERK